MFVWFGNRKSLSPSGVDVMFKPKVRERFKIDHPNAILVENSVNRNERDRNTEIMDPKNSNILSHLYSKYFKEKNGSTTVETITTHSNQMKVHKETIK
ncbi:MAG: hypothetical protein QM731_09900 [Chitinophagaceae bacterium]